LGDAGFIFWDEAPFDGSLSFAADCFSTFGEGVSAEDRLTCMDDLYT
jgi:hypothetical protein